MAALRNERAHNNDFLVRTALQRGGESRFRARRNSWRLVDVSCLEERTNCCRRRWWWQCWFRDMDNRRRRYRRGGEDGSRRRGSLTPGLYGPNRFRARRRRGVAAWRTYGCRWLRPDWCRPLWRRYRCGLAILIYSDRRCRTLFRLRGGTLGCDRCGNGRTLIHCRSSYSLSRCGCIFRERWRLLRLGRCECGMEANPIGAANDRNQEQNAHQHRDWCRPLLSRSRGLRKPRRVLGLSRFLREEGFGPGAPGHRLLNPSFTLSRSRPDRVSLTTDRRC